MKSLGNARRGVPSIVRCIEGYYNPRRMRSPLGYLPRTGVQNRPGIGAHMNDDIAVDGAPRCRRRADAVLLRPRRRVRLGEADTRARRDARLADRLGLCSSTYPTQMGAASARVTLSPQGRVIVQTAAHEIGQGVDILDPTKDKSNIGVITTAQPALPANLYLQPTIR
ncbi:hypothetical protein [Sphingomonas bacterium]|uniref:hypothetical protein n=1 Tax=Sphingomonas bacterium TaxID=1895847 RepID=UPI001575E3FD|nr:hypothetical protein [Sphingomonas bacterium]